MISLQLQDTKLMAALVIILVVTQMVQLRLLVNTNEKVLIRPEDSGLQLNDKILREGYGSSLRSFHSLFVILVLQAAVLPNQGLLALRHVVKTLEQGKELVRLCVLKLYVDTSVSALSLLLDKLLDILRDLLKIGVVVD